MPDIFDLRSDTAIQPTAAMVEGLCGLHFADDLLGEDSATNTLLAHVSDQFGMASALITPSGTMSNQIAAAVISRPGAEVVVGDASHIYNLEVGGLAATSGVQVRTVRAESGEYALGEIEAALRSTALQVSPTSGILLESTYNLNAGHVTSLENLAAIRELANRHGVFVYLDGARVFNAAVALDVPLQEVTRHVDAIQICLNKGLGGPLGSVLIGSEAFINEARLVRQRLGGGLRHTGFIAAPGLLAFEDWRARMTQDHAHAKLLEDALSSLPNAQVVNGPVETNIVTFEVQSTDAQIADMQAMLVQSGVHVKSIGHHRFRAVTHSTLSRADIEYCAAVIVETITAATGRSEGEAPEMNHGCSTGSLGPKR